MKKFARRVMFGLAAAIMLLLAGCGMDSAELGEYVKKEMQEELVKTSGLKDLKMTQVRLVKGEGINYSGVGKGDIEGYPVKFDVVCKYDGSTVLWDASLSGDNIFSLAAMEKGRMLGKKLRESWPDIKKTLVEKYDNASQKVGEYYNSTKKKAGECLDGAKRKQQDIGGEK